MMDPFTEVILMKVCVMVLACKSMKMVPDTRESGRTAKDLGKASFSSLVEIFMRGSGKRIKLTGMGHTFMQMELSMKGTGKMTYKMEMAQRNGMMAVNMRVPIKMA
jgi:hypothetical protein